MNLHSVPIMSTTVPLMSTISEQIGLLEVSFEKMRRLILALLYSHTDESFYLRKILRLTGVSPGAGQRELRKNYLRQGLCFARPGIPTFIFRQMRNARFLAN